MKIVISAVRDACRLHSSVYRGSWTWWTASKKRIPRSWGPLQQLLPRLVGDIFVSRQAQKTEYRVHCTSPAIQVLWSHFPVPIPLLSRVIKDERSRFKKHFAQVHQVEAYHIPVHCLPLGLHAVVRALANVSPPIFRWREVQLVVAAIVTQRVMMAEDGGAYWECSSRRRHKSRLYLEFPRFITWR